jgi:hypothetical protein
MNCFNGTHYTTNRFLLIPKLLDMQKYLYYCTITVLLCICCSCLFGDESIDPRQSITGFRPVYSVVENVHRIEVQAAKPITKAGKIFVVGNTLYQNDVNEGIHVIDISNPANPVKKMFINVPFSTELAVKNGFLYTNNFDDIVVINLNNTTPNVIKRIEKVFNPVNQDYPPFFNVAFECVDKSKGVVVGWERVTLQNPLCRR